MLCGKRYRKSLQKYSVIAVNFSTLAQQIATFLVPLMVIVGWMYMVPSLTNYPSSRLTRFGSTHHEMTLFFEDFEVKEGTLCRWLSMLIYLLVDCYLICVGSSRQHYHSVGMLLHQSVTHADLLCPGTENLTISRVLCKVFRPFLGSRLLL